jgi:hypothetical protein
VGGGGQGEEGECEEGSHGCRIAAAVAEDRCNGRGHGWGIRGSRLFRSIPLFD